jgi:hypothetical protein
MRDNAMVLDATNRILSCNGGTSFHALNQIPNLLRKYNHNFRPPTQPNLLSSKLIAKQPAVAVRASVST